MTVFITRRIFQTIPVLFGVSIVVFVLLRFVPGDPAAYLAGPEASPEVVEAVRHRLGLDRPIPVQYVLWLGSALRGDFGISYVKGMPNAELVWSRVPATLELATAGLLFTIAFGLPLGALAALRHGSIWDYLVSGFNALALGIPSFWLGILLIMVFSVHLGWLPPGFRVEFSRGIAPALKSLLLPALTLGISHAPILARFLRNGILDVMHEDYIRTARAKGLSSAAIFTRHVLRNAMIPVITILGITFGRLLGGVVITEAVFSWPGMGTLLITSIGNRDYGLVQATILLIVMSFVFINLLVDIAYGWLDPRLRLGQAR